MFRYPVMQGYEKKEVVPGIQISPRETQVSDELRTSSKTRPSSAPLSEGLSRVIRQSNTLIAVVVLALIALHLLFRFVFHLTRLEIDLPLFAALLFGGVPLVWDLIRKMWQAEFGSDLIAGVSIITAILLHEYLVAAIVVLMLSGGQALEQYATERASSVLRALAHRMPVEAHLVKGTGFSNVPVNGISPGDLLLVFPHEICPVDGEVIEGYGRMDESFLTGEPFEISKAPGTRVISGAINGDAALKIRATKIVRESRYARILSVVKQSEENRPRLRRMGDLLGAWYTPFALGLAILGWIFSGTPERFLATIVIATPCPLLLAIPVAILGGISLAARRGIVVRKPAVLEQVDSCRTFIFDKTGTLTYGRPMLVDVYCAPGYEQEEVLSLAASLEQYSRHPLASGILNAAENRKLVITAPLLVTEKPGDGLRGVVGKHSVHITGRGKAGSVYDFPKSLLPPLVSGLECLVFIDGHYAAALRFQDELKDESSPFIRHLSHKHGAKRVILLSGDKESEVRHLAGLVGIEEVYSGKSPEEKLEFVKTETQRQKTLFVGDGINDAPAMLAATVGLAMGGTSDVIAESADAVVLDSSVRKIDELIHIGRRMTAISLQSALGGILLSMIGMLAAVTGHLSPINGAIAQEVIDLFAVLNALRATTARALADF